MGLSTGRVYCGNCGSTKRCEYCVVGSYVNDAARLCALAWKRGGGVLIDSSTLEFLRGGAGGTGAGVGFFGSGAGTLVAGGLRCGAEFEVTVKGRDRPIFAAPLYVNDEAASTASPLSPSLGPQVESVWLRSSPLGGPESAPAATLDEPFADLTAGLSRQPFADEVFVGREKEMAAVRPLLRRFAAIATGGLGQESSSGGPAAIAFAGGHGLGKSALLRAVARELESSAAAGADVCWLVGDESERDTPWLAWVTPWMEEMLTEVLPRLPPQVRARTRFTCAEIFAICVLSSIPFFPA